MSVDRSTANQITLTSSSSADLSAYSTTAHVNSVVTALQAQIANLVSSTPQISFTALGISMAESFTISGYEYWRLSDLTGTPLTRTIAQINGYVGGTLTDSNRTFTNSGFVCTMLSISELQSFMGSTALPSGLKGPWIWSSTPGSGDHYYRITRNAGDTSTATNTFTSATSTFHTLWRVVLETVTA